MTPASWVFFAGNVITLFIGIVAIGRWFRNWLVKTVSEPIKKLQVTAENAEKSAERANIRLDQHLEAHAHG